jgi:hypothetical protein
MQPQGDTAMIGEPHKKATFGKSYQSIDSTTRLYDLYLDYIISGSDSYNDYKTNIMNDEKFLIYSIRNGLITNIINKEKDRTLSRLLKEKYNIIINYLNNNEPIENKIKLIKLIIDWRFETRDLKNFEQNINLKEINTKIQNNQLTEDEEKSYQKFYNMALNDEQKRKEICEILKLDPDDRFIKGDYDFAGGKSRTNKKKQKKTKKNKKSKKTTRRR